MHPRTLTVARGATDSGGAGAGVTVESAQATYPSATGSGDLALDGSATRPPIDGGEGKADHPCTGGILYVNVA